MWRSKLLLAMGLNRLSTAGRAAHDAFSGIFLSSRCATARKCGGEAAFCTPFRFPGLVCPPGALTRHPTGDALLGGLGAGRGGGDSGSWAEGVRGMGMAARKKFWWKVCTPTPMQKLTGLVAGLRLCLTWVERLFPSLNAGLAVQTFNFEKDKSPGSPILVSPNRLRRS